MKKFNDYGVFNASDDFFNFSSKLAVPRHLEFASGEELSLSLPMAMFALKHMGALIGIDLENTKNCKVERVYFYASIINWADDTDSISPAHEYTLYSTKQNLEDYQFYNGYWNKPKAVVVAAYLKDGQVAKIPDAKHLRYEFNDYLLAAGEVRQWGLLTYGTHFAMVEPYSLQLLVSGQPIEYDLDGHCEPIDPDNYYRDKRVKNYRADHTNSELDFTDRYVFVDSNGNLRMFDDYTKQTELYMPSAPRFLFYSHFGSTLTEVQFVPGNIVYNVNNGDRFIVDQIDRENLKLVLANSNGTIEDDMANYLVYTKLTA